MTPFVNTPPKNRNWNKSRYELLDTAAYLVVDRNYTLETVAQHIVESHYMGKSRPSATVCFVRDLKPVVGKRQYEVWAKKQGVISGMAAELQAEGWRFVPAYDDSPGGFWMHDGAGCQVNQNGGHFRSFEEATLRAYESATRAWLKEKEAAWVAQS